MTHTPNQITRAVKMCVQKGIPYTASSLAIDARTLKRWCIRETESMKEQISLSALSLILERIERSKKNEELIYSFISSLEFDRDLTQSERKQIIIKINSLYTMSSAELASLEEKYKIKPQKKSPAASEEETGSSVTVSLEGEVEKWAK